MSVKLRLKSLCFAFSFLTTACGGGGGGAVPGGVSPTSAPAQSFEAICPESAPSSATDDWKTLGHDSLNSGCQPQQTGISSTTVSKLKLHWKYAAGDQIVGGPVVVNGTVYAVTLDNGTVLALKASNGSLLWSHQLGGSGVEVRMIPAYDDGMVFIGTHNFAYNASTGNFDAKPSYLYALDAQSGAVVWQANLPGPIRATPATINGKLYVGVSGGDLPTCFQGGVYQIDEKTGARGWAFYVDPDADDGGSVWAPIAFDGTNLIVTTGNTCAQSVLTANGIIALDPQSGHLVWQYNTYNPVYDYDVGSGALLTHGEAVALGKNGTIYYLDQNSGTLLASKQFGTTTSGAGFSTPATDGRFVFVRIAQSGVSAASSTMRRGSTERFFGRISPASSAGSGMLVALDMSGNLVWSVPTQTQTSNSVALNNGVVFADLDDEIVALDAGSGKNLWSYPFGTQVLASPAVVPSGVFTADGNGNIYAFGF